MLLGILQLAMVFLATSRGRVSQLKIVILLSILFSRAVVSSEIAIFMIALVFIDNFLSLCDKNLVIKMDKIIKSFKQVEKIKTYFKLRIKKNIILGPYSGESEKYSKTTTALNSVGSKAYLDQYELKGSVIIFGLFCLTLLLGLINNG